MENRITIKSIHIKNFRSIRSETINAKDLNIFVGLNDAGKSNFLKALNLFFNNSTDYDNTFDFEKDFSYLFPENSHSTKEIVIEIKFNIPKTFSNSGVYAWKKVWRNYGLHLDEITADGGKSLLPRSRIPSALKKLKFRYVPAVKSKQYYKELLGELYLTVSSVINSPLENAINSFSSVLQDYTLNIHDEVKKRLNIDSLLTMPDNLTDVFKAMIFQTYKNDIDKPIPLDMRGDGLQSGHIPIILKYIEEQDRKTTNKGSMNVFTIWGYEEPENGIELMRAFELADSFQEYSSSIQIFTTSHSPAFYMKKQDDNISVFYVSQNDKSNGTKASEKISVKDVSETMGLMPIVAPYIADKEKKLKTLKEEYMNERFIDIPTIAVEGKTDKKYITCAIELFSVELSRLLKENKLRIFTKEGEGGCLALVDYTCAWIYSKNQSKLTVLFDKDEAGKDAHNKLVENEIFKSKGSKKITVRFLQPSESIISIFQEKLDIYYEIEHLLSLECWMEMIEKNWTEPRSVSELVDIIGNVISIDTSTKEYIENIIDDERIRDTIVLRNPKTDKKGAICDWIMNQTEEKRREYMLGFKRTIKMLEELFL